MTRFDPVKYKDTTREQSQTAAKVWSDYGLAAGAGDESLHQMLAGLDEGGFEGQRELVIAVGTKGDGGSR